MQSLAEQKLILTEIKALREGGGNPNGPANRKATSPSDAPGNVMIHSLSGYLSEKEEERQLYLLREAMDMKLASLHSPAGEHTLHSALDFQVPGARKSTLQTDFVLSLHYREREYRESAISSPYDKTFKWMFSSDTARKNADFPLWLASSSCLFWITGKAGSGKSTLMKYVSDFQSKGEGATLCRKHLGRWAGSSELATASFYFWASGAEIQASKKAMYQSLLFQLLRESPDIIPRIVPKRWESACLFGTPFPDDWTEEGLRDLLFSTVKELSKKSAKVCLFIDGLDEFGGGLQEIIAVVKRISQLSNVKLCVSSRPWQEFEDAFGRGPSLRVQDLTYPDIKHFVESHFEKSEGFTRLMERESDYGARLVDQIITKSSGVFLWVRIVVQSLVAGLTNDDRIRDLENRLNSLPPDLEQLYAKILRDLDPFYLVHACQYFQLMLANDSSAEALLLSFADEEKKDFAVKLPFGSLSNRERSRRVETIRRRLNSRCRGLLEVDPTERVNFLHRSVRDFLVKPDILEKIDNATKGTTFDVHLQLCSAYYCMLMTDENEIGTRIRIERCLESASRVAIGKHHMINILDSLHKNSKTYPNLLPPKLYDSYTEGHLSLRKSFGFVFEDGFLSLATRFGITGYIGARLPPGAISWVTYQTGAAVAPTFFPKKPARPRPFMWFFRREVREVSTPSTTTGGKRARLPLLLDACFVFPPNIDLFRCIMEGEPDYNLRVGTEDCFAFQFRYGRDGFFVVDGCTILAVVVAVAIITTGSKSSSADQGRVWKLWSSVLNLFRECGAGLDSNLASMVARGFGTNIKGKPEGFPRTRIEKTIRNVLESVQSKSTDSINWAALRHELRMDIQPLETKPGTSA